MTFLQSIEAIFSVIIQLVVIFPYSALTIPRQLPLRLPPPPLHARNPTPSDPESPLNTESVTMISDKVYKLCTSPESVSSLLARDPTIAPGEAWKTLYGGHAAGEKESKTTARGHRDNVTPEDLKRAAECGKWGPTEPSELFLRMYHDALCTLDNSVSGAMVSPSLMGSCGVIPLSVISVIPQIAAHMANLIVRADKEVFLATNYWVSSVASSYITDAMKELSRRAGQRGSKIIMKMLYDRGSPKQLVEPHYIVGEKEYLSKAVNLPKSEDIPNIDLQVMNYHRPMLGTFHCKYMVVDRKYAVLQSNNIQDNDNLEMMTHLEGPIVDSMYDMALISWDKKLDPPLPSYNSPAVDGGLGSFGDKSHAEIFGPDGSLKGHSAIVHPDHMPDRKAYEHEHRIVKQPGAVPNQASNDTSDTGRVDVLTGPTKTDDVIRPAGSADVDGKIPEVNKSHIDESQSVVSKGEDIENPNPNDTTNGSTPATGPDTRGSDTATREFLGSGEQAIPNSQIQDPSPDDENIPEHTPNDLHYDVDIAGEVARVQASVSAKPGETRSGAVTRHLNHTTNKGFKGTAPECAPNEEMTPYIPHPVHEPFPIAMVCREPYGTPNHHSVYNPQNEVWLSALRNAKKNVFIQTPTLNAEPLVPAIFDACERGIDVFCYICLGYNDTGELLPMQGGTNEMVAHKLHTSLSATGKSHLHWFWYIAKDQTVPLVQKKKKRSCHIKLMLVDEHIGIQGNGNQDTQSWYHSQEINVMWDSAVVSKGIIDGLRRNQNTHIYGEVDNEDGVWRDAQGKEADDVIGVDPGRFSWAKGMMGAVNRVRGTGGF